MKKVVLLLSLTIFSFNGFAQIWEIQQSGTTSHLNDVTFLDSQKGFIVGESSTILKTSDAGSTWINVFSPISGISFQKILFIDNNVGFIIGSKGTILRTNNGGNSWEIKYQELTYFFNNIFFVNSSLGWICGGISNLDYGGVIISTNDGGITWIKQLETLNSTELPRVRIDDIFFFDNYNGIATGNFTLDPLGPTRILKTENGGNNWFLFSYTESKLVHYLTKTSKDTIWAGGFGFEVSIDKGKTWKYQGFKFVIQDNIEQTGTVIYYMLQLTGKQGYLISFGWNDQKRRLFYTDNVFNSFKNVMIPDGITPNALTKNEENYFWLVGTNGIIMKGKNIITGIKTSSIKFTENFDLIQNYPNPFNPTTKISFSIQQKSQIKLKVFDVLGREIANLAEGVYEVGKYEVTFDASKLPSGVYFYNLSTGNNSISKKMLLIK